jgi:hypothetical protein
MAHDMSGYRLLWLFLITNVVIPTSCNLKFDGEDSVNSIIGRSSQGHPEAVTTINSVKGQLEM